MDQASLFVLFALVAVPAFFFFAEHSTGWRLWFYVPPLLWIYATPLLLQLAGVLPAQSPVYDGLRAYALPLFITVLVMIVDLKTVIASLGRALPVLLLSTTVVIVTAPIGYLAASPWLPPGAWLAFGALAGSWIGGTANMAAVAQALGTPADQMGWAIIADQSLALVFIPLMIASARYVDRFNAWVGAKPIVVGEASSAEAKAEAAEEGGREAAIEVTEAERKAAWPPMLDLLLMTAVAMANVVVCAGIASMLPELPPVLNRTTWVVLLVSTGAVLLSLTPIRRSEQAKVVGTALLYVFVANMGASASVEGFADAPAFIFGAAVWLTLATLILFLAAKWMRTDLRIAVLAINANIGGVASNPVVAAAHDRSLVPVAIMMAVLCYVYGNYGGILTGHLVRLAGG